MSPGDKASLSLRRIARAILATILGIVAINFAVDAVLLALEIEHAGAVRPVNYAVDLSIAGVQLVPFKQDGKHAHGFTLYLCFPEQTDRQPSDIHGLNVTFTVTKEDGTFVAEIPFPYSSFDDWGSNRDQLRTQSEFAMARFESFPDGDYVLHVQVHEPAPALAGHRQVIVAKNWMCGCEGLPMVLAGVLAIITGLPALAIGKIGRAHV